jgi:hypothetical protein
LRARGPLRPRPTHAALRALRTSCADTALATLCALGARARGTLRAGSSSRTGRSRYALSTLRSLSTSTTSRALRAGDDGGCAGRTLGASQTLGASSPRTALGSLGTGCALCPSRARHGAGRTGTSLRTGGALSTHCALSTGRPLRSHCPAAATTLHPDTGVALDRAYPYRPAAVDDEVALAVMPRSGCPAGRPAHEAGSSPRPLQADGVEISSLGLAV